jgi:hypothetical protein
MAGSGKVKSTGMIGGGNSVGRVCYPFLIFGTTEGQGMWLAGGFLVASLVYGNNPDSGFGGAKERFLAALALVLCAVFVRFWRNLRVLSGAEITWATVGSVAKDVDADEDRFNLVLEFPDCPGPARRFGATRNVNDLVIGTKLRLAICRAREAGFLEAELFGGITFGNLYFGEPVPLISWWRILVGGCLMVVPLAGLFPVIEGFLKEATAKIRHPVLYWWTIYAQAVWMFVKWRYFVSGKPIKF